MGQWRPDLTGVGLCKCIMPTLQGGFLPLPAVGLKVSPPPGFDRSIAVLAVGLVLAVTIWGPKGPGKSS